jgi:hypothetical protein
VRTAIAVTTVIVGAALAAIALLPASSEPDREAQRRTEPPPAVVLGTDQKRIFKLDPRTLEPLRGRRVAHGGLYGRVTAFSGDRSKIVLGAPHSEGPGVRGATLRFVDLERMRPLADDMRLARRGSIIATAWPAPRHVLAILQKPDSSFGEAVVHQIDPVAGRVLGRRPLHGSIHAFARFGGGLVLLAGPPRSVGRARLVVVDAHDGVRGVSLPPIRAGQALSERYSGGRYPMVRPGLAVDPARGRAFVVGASGPLAEVDLASLRVAYHELSQPVSLLGRLRDLLEPEAHAHHPQGPIRQALWLGNGRIAVWGVGIRGSNFEELASGLKLIDTRDWTVRTIDDRATDAALVGGILLAWGPITESGKSIGVAGYSVKGERRFRLFSGKSVIPRAMLGDRAYFDVGRSWPKVSVVDVRAGRVLGTRSLDSVDVLDADRQFPDRLWPPLPP